MRKFYMVY